uniref:Uncharacterized protein n=1 Tax=Cacopsylla melanoneura TaxID=428564 RepID=A0A8D9AUU3_9HEMI
MFYYSYISVYCMNTVRLDYYIIIIACNIFNRLSITSASRLPVIVIGFTINYFNNMSGCTTIQQSFIDNFNLNSFVLIFIFDYREFCLWIRINGITARVRSERFQTTIDKD